MLIAILNLSVDFAFLFILPFMVFFCIMLEFSLSLHVCVWIYGMFFDLWLPCFSNVLTPSHISACFRLVVIKAQTYSSNTHIHIHKFSFSSAPPPHIYDFHALLYNFMFTFLLYIVVITFTHKKLIYILA